MTRGKVTISSLDVVVPRLQVCDGGDVSCVAINLLAWWLALGLAASMNCILFATVEGCVLYYSYISARAVRAHQLTFDMVKGSGHS